MNGSLQGSNSPAIKIELYGIMGRQNPPQLFDAIIDTGFTGGVSMPVTLALPLGLILKGTAYSTYANGDTEEVFLCIGGAVLDNKENLLVFSLSKGNDILLGTEFLRSFNAKLELDYISNTFSVVPQAPPAPALPSPTPQLPHP